MTPIRIAATDHEDLQPSRRGLGRDEGPRGLAHQGGIRRPPHRRL